MKVINAEGIVWGLLPEETKQQIREAFKNNRHKVYLYRGVEWVTLNNLPFCGRSTYKAEIPEIKKAPWERDDYIKNNINMIKKKDDKDYYTIAAWYESIVNVAGAVFTYKDMAELFTLPDGSPLYKEIES